MNYKSWKILLFAGFGLLFFAPLYYLGFVDTIYSINDIVEIDGSILKYKERKGGYKRSPGFKIWLNEFYCPFSIPASNLKKFDSDGFKISEINGRSIVLGISRRDIQRIKNNSKWRCIIYSIRKDSNAYLQSSSTLAEANKMRVIILIFTGIFIFITIIFNKLLQTSGEQGIKSTAKEPI